MMQTISSPFHTYNAKITKNGHQVNRNIEVTSRQALLSLFRFSSQDHLDFTFIENEYPSSSLELWN